MTIRLAIAHAAWLPDRGPSLERLLRQLAGDGSQADVQVFGSKHREHASVWAQRIWARAAEVSAPTVILNDDVTVCQDFVRACEAIAETVPDELVSLHCQAPGATALAADGHRWARSYWYSGPSVLVTPAISRDMLAFWQAMPWEYASRINEDVASIHWQWANQRPAWQAIPALAHHDVAVPSSLGYDAHPFRTPSVPFGMEVPTDVASWTPRATPPLIDNPWAPTSYLERVRRALRSGAPIKTPMPFDSTCWWCGRHGGTMSSSATGALLCMPCLDGMSLAANRGARDFYQLGLAAGAPKPTAAKMEAP